MKEFPFKTLDPTVYTLAVVIVGLMIDDGYNKAELNTIGNWLILVGQIALTTASQMNLLDENDNHSPY